MEYVTLNNGVKMPMLGFGVWQVFDAQVCEESVASALRTGYRLVDTAAAYMNEEAVGRAVASAMERDGISREELFITTKLWVQDAGYENTKTAIQSSLDKLGLDYLDLYLVHQPLGDYYGSWRAMEEACEAGTIKAIGVCNFTPDRLADLCIHSKVTPAVNQVQIHPFCQQNATFAAMKEYGVQPQAWGPIAQGSEAAFQNESLLTIGKKHGKTAAQVMLRWHMQRGVVAIPKSVHEERIKENYNIFDFELDGDEMAAIAGLNVPENESNGIYPVNGVRYMCCEYKVHD